MKYSVKNFRVFDENGVKMELAPMTIITGANSAGKSSIAKSFLLLDSFLKKVKETILTQLNSDSTNIQISLDDFTLDFTSYPNNLLGSYENILNYTTHNKHLFFEYTIYSYILSKEIIVRIEFAPNSKNKISGCKLASLIMYTKNATDNKIEIFFSSASKDSMYIESDNHAMTIVDMHPLWKDALIYAAAELVLHDIVGDYDEQLDLESQTLGQAFGQPSRDKDFCTSLKSKFDKSVAETHGLTEKRINDAYMAYQLNNKSIGGLKSRHYELCITKALSRMDYNREKGAEEDALDSIKETLKGRKLFYSAFAEKLSEAGKDREALLELIDREVYQKMEKQPEHRLVIVVSNLIDKFIVSEYATFSEFYDSHVERLLNIYDKPLYLNMDKDLDLLSDKDGDEIYNILDLYTSWLVPIYRWGKYKDDVPYQENNPKTPEGKDLLIKRLDNDFLTIDLHAFDIYYIVMQLEAIYSKKTNHHFAYRSKDVSYKFQDFNFPALPLPEEGDYTQYFSAHYTYYVLREVVKEVIYDALTPDWAGNINYVSSSRAADIRRFYPLDATDEFTQLLRRYVDKGCFLQEESFINKWIKKFSIANSVSIDVMKFGLEPIGIQVILHKENGKDTLLADEGFGLSQLLSILLHIEALSQTRTNNPEATFEIEYDERDKTKKPKKIFEDIEYYPSNTFKIVFAQNDVPKYKPSILIVEEPEIHLHPRFQSLLAEMFVDAYKTYNIQFIIETHSEYLIRKLQTLVADKENDLHIKTDDVSILYVNNVENINIEEDEPHVKQIYICEDGYLDGTFGPGFYDEATSLTRKLMSL